MAITESFKQNVVTLKLNLAILPYIPFTLTYPQNLYIEDNRKKCKFFVIPQNNTYSLKVPHLGKTHVLVAWTDAQTAKTMHRSRSQVRSGNTAISLHKDM